MTKQLSEWVLFKENKVTFFNFDSSTGPFYTPKDSFKGPYDDRLIGIRSPFFSAAR